MFDWLTSVPSIRYSVRPISASALTQQQVKVLIEAQVKEYWSVIQSTLGFTTQEHAYGFFLGMATRESTLQGGFWMACALYLCLL